MAPAIPVELLVVLAIGFAAVNGANDGAALIGAGLKVRALSPLVAILFLSCVVALGPILVGTAVARTIAEQLVVGQGADARTLVAVSVVTSVAVVAVLARAGLPTSLTLALIGGLAGGALGLSLPVPWGEVGFVLAVGAVAPLVGGLLGYLAMGLLARVPTGDVARTVRRAHLGGFGLQCLAYAANDGQKIFAVLALATGAAGAALDLRPWHLVVTGVAFFVGACIGAPLTGGTLANDVLSLRPPQAAAAEVGSACAVFGSAALGAPVSMTQSIAGALIGAGASESFYRVRWRVAGHLGLAWVVTLPAGFVVAALAAWALGAAR